MRAFGPQICPIALDRNKRNKSNMPTKMYKIKKNKDY